MKTDSDKHHAIFSSSFNAAIIFDAQAEVDLIPRSATAGDCAGDYGGPTNSDFQLIDT